MTSTVHQRSFYSSVPAAAPGIRATTATRAVVFCVLEGEVGGSLLQKTLACLQLVSHAGPPPQPLVGACVLA